MGRNIPSISSRIERKAMQWRIFSRMLPPSEQFAYDKLLSIARNRRSAIDAADEAELEIAMLLAMVVSMRGELDQLSERIRQNEKHQERDSSS